MIELVDHRYYKSVSLEPLERGEVTGIAVRFEPEILESLENISELTLPPPLENAVTKRKSEYLLGRVLAATVLGQIGRQSEFPGTENRKPIWPRGIVGSISHTDNLAGCMISESVSLRGVGLDFEKRLEKDRATRMSSHIFTKDDEGYLI